MSHQIVRLVTIATCSCGFEVDAETESHAEQLMADHVRDPESSDDAGSELRRQRWIDRIADAQLHEKGDG